MASAVQWGAWVWTTAAASGRLRRMSWWKRHSVDGFSGPVQASPSSPIAARSPGRISSYGVADGVMSMRPSRRAEMLPEVPWLIPSAFICRAASTMAWRRVGSSMAAR